MKNRKGRGKRAWWLFMLQVSLVVAIFVFGLYLGVYLRDRNLINDQILGSAQAHFQNIVLTRMWSAKHGGVYVEKKPGVETNPYLEDPEIRSTDGRVFTKRNPALMTREISELADIHGMFTYHITSRNPLNPDNTPDAFEWQALKQFSEGEKEAFTEEERGDRTFFRYMAPLETIGSCLQCHAKQGYKIGDIRGGISVTFDITDIKKRVRRNRDITLGLIGFSTALVVGVFLIFTFRLMRQLRAAHKEIEKMVITDELTGLPNRRHFYDRLVEEVDRANRYDTPLSLIMIDIDRFKRVNDTFGHPLGDLVLKEVGRLLAANIRTSDIVARYGGEEFVVLIPAQDADKAAQAAEKLRTVVEVNDICMEGPQIQVTISCGVADLKSVDKGDGELKDALVLAADNAMYQAKTGGRNQVKVYRPKNDKHIPLV